MKALGKVLAVIGTLIGIVLIGFIAVGIGAAVEQRIEADEQAYFVEHGTEAVGVPQSIVDQRSGGRYNRNQHEYAMVYSFTREDGSAGEVRGPWKLTELVLGLDLQDGTTATVLYLDDSPEHGDRAGQAVVLDETPG